MVSDHGARFASDLERFISPSRPIALARFHDGEYHVLASKPYDARSGWHLHRESWLRPRLLESLSAKLDDYWVGISPPCDYPLGTAFLRQHVQTKLLTFATVFWHRNHPRFVGHVRANLGEYCLVGSSARCTHRVPANGVAKEWDLDGLVTTLLGEKRSILLAAGPCACVIVHEYWKRADPAQRQTILDAGAALDPIIHGRNTRSFVLHHACSWTAGVPWSAGGARKVKGYRARLAGLRTRYGGKKKDDARSR